MTFPIGRRIIGPGHPVFIVAELSANHRQNFDEAIALVKAAKDAGADAVKLQTYTPDTITIDAPGEHFQVRGGTLWDGRTLYHLYQEAYTPWEWHAPLKALTTELGMEFFSSAFDPSSVDFLEDLGVPIHKLASFEIVDIPLVRKAASTGKPLILSTGMATLAEIEEAVSAARGAGAPAIALLKCTSAYPAPAEDINLRTIAHLEQAFEAPTGLSDHTSGIAVPVAAVAMGARLIEKHITLSRAAGGPDAAFSLEPQEFRAMTDAVRLAEASLGAVHYGITAREATSRTHRRSLFAVQDIRRGDRLTTVNIRSIRPGAGLHPRYLDRLIDCDAACDIPRGTPLEWKHISSAVSARRRQE